MPNHGSSCKRVTTNGVTPTWLKNYEKSITTQVDTTCRGKTIARGLSSSSQYALPNGQRYIPCHGSVLDGQCQNKAHKEHCVYNGQRFAIHYVANHKTERISWWSERDHATKMIEEDIQTCVYRCSTPVFNRFIRISISGLMIAFTITFASLFFLSRSFDMGQYAADNPWLYGLTAALLAGLSFVYCFGWSKEWKSSTQLGLLLVTVVVITLILSVFVVVKVAELMWHAMGIILILLFVCVMMACSDTKRFRFIVAWLLCGVAAVVSLFLFVYLPYKNKIHSIHEWQYMPDEAWHMVTVILLAVGVVVYILFVLYRMTLECPRYDFLYAIFYVYFHLMVFSFIYKQVSNRFGLKSIRAGANQQAVVRVQHGE